MSKYTASEVVQLPRLTAVGAMALGERLLTAAKPAKKQLVKGIARVLDALVTRHGELAAALRDQVVLPTEGEENEDAVRCDRILDNCWSGLLDFLTAFTKLPPDTPQSAEASALKVTIFGAGGLKFTQLPYLLQWSESELRIQRIRKNGLDKRIEALGGELFFIALEAAHGAYGKALGVTAPAPAGAESPPSVRQALDAFTEALRAYVIKVMGMVEPDEPETRALADQLLAPLDGWHVGPSGRGAARKNGSPEGDTAASSEPGAPPSAGVAPAEA